MIGLTFGRYIGVVVGVTQPQTQTSQAERGLLCRFLPGRKAIVEVGVFEGFTTRVLADAADSDATVYGVDPFFSGRLGISWGQKMAAAHNRGHLQSNKVKFVRTLSTEVSDQVPDEVDYVFIDADHSLPGITADWAFWSQRVKPGGIIAAHDVVRLPGGPEFGSQQHFDATIRHDPNFEVVGQQDSLAVLQKRLAAA